MDYVFEKVEGSTVLAASFLVVIHEAERSQLDLQMHGLVGEKLTRQHQEMINEALHGAIFGETIFKVGQDVKAVC